MRKVYLAGHMLTKGSQMQRKAEADDIRQLGHELYNPQDNKEINDKASADPEGLAERIVKHDTDAIKWADTVVIEPLAEAQGTLVELGQIHGMKMMAKLVQKAMFDGKPVNDVCRQVLGQQVFPHFEDIRRQGQTEAGDRRSLGINQYVYGVCLDLTEGKGFYEWDEIKEKLCK